jgi:hypothetical protein
MGGGAVGTDFKDRNIPDSSSPVCHQPVFVLPTQPLEGQLPIQGRRLRPLGLATAQPHGKSAAGVLLGLASRVGLQPLRKVIGDARVERAVTAAEDVDEPAGRTVAARKGRGGH